MIELDVFQVQSRTRMWARLMRSPIDQRDRVVWIQARESAGYWRHADALEIAAELPDGAAAPIRAPACGCCGEWRPAKVREHWLQDTAATRCEKHVGRAPCYVAGCGKTFRLEPAATYRQTFVCGAHYRLAPKRLRDLRTLIRRRLRTARAPARIEKLEHQDWLAWRMIERAIARRASAGGEGFVDLAEIERLFGL